MWDGVDKTKLVQYKLKVELGQDVLSIVEQTATGVTADPAV